MASETVTKFQRICVNGLNCIFLNFSQRCHLTDLIASACGDDCIRVFQEDTENSQPDAPNYKLSCTVQQAHLQDVNGIAWNPKILGLLASAGDDCLVKLWKIVEDD